MQEDFPVSDIGDYLKTQFSLEGRTALVTGGAGGIGRTLAFALCSAGATTAVCDLNLVQAEEVADGEMEPPHLIIWATTLCNTKNIIP